MHILKLEYKNVGFYEVTRVFYVQMENGTVHEIQFSTKSIFPNLIIHLELTYYLKRC